MNNNTEKNKATGIKTWPEEDRPREKLLKKGAKVACAKFALTSKGLEKGRG